MLKLNWLVFSEMYPLALNPNTPEDRQRRQLAIVSLVHELGHVIGLAHEV